MPPKTLDGNRAGWRRLMRRLAPVALALAACGAAVAADAPTATLTVTFHGLKTADGAVRLALDGDKAAFDGKGAPAGQASIAIKDGQATAVFANLAPGTYAVRAFHDQNGDGVLNLNPFGIPTEPYAFSNDARGMAGPPSWSAAAFEVKAGDNAQSIALD
jgi:uncharacterized protein (DUF2141 family)